MGIAVYCQNGHRFKVKDEFAGKRVLCPQCQVKVRIPAPAEIAAPAAAGGMQPARLLELDPAVIAALPRALPFCELPVAEAPPAAAAIQPLSPERFASEPPPPQPFLHPSIASQPDLHWRIAFPGGEPTEPLAAETMQAWLDSRQATGTEMVWRTDWPEWMPVRNVFPEYF